MSTRNRKVVACLLALVFGAWGAWLGTQAHAQESRPTETEKQDESDYAVTFGRAVGMPGQAVALSVFFTRRSDVPNIRKLRLRLSFPTAALSYDKLEAAYLARRAGLELRPIQGGSGNNGTLDLTFTLPESSSREFPNGQIAYVHFTVSSEAKGGAISLHPEAWIEEKPIPSPEFRARLEDAKIIVTTSPILVGCFFFTH